MELKKYQQEVINDLTQFIEEMGVQKTKEWIAKAKGLNNE